MPQQRAVAKVAEKLNLNLNDEFVSSHGLRETGEEHADTKFKVKGVLEFSNSVADQLILTSPASVWEIHSDHNHDEDINNENLDQVNDLEKSEESNKDDEIS